MKFNCNLFLYFMLLHTSAAYTMQPKQAPIAKIAPKAVALPAAKAVSARAAPTRAVPATATPELNVPYLSELHAAATQPEIINAWQTLYEVYQQRTNNPADTTLTPAQTTAMAPLFETNHFAQMQKLVTPQTFPKLPNDPQGTLHTSYATFHLNKALSRLASVSNIEYNNGTPEVNFAGDNRDMGIIVNIQNNTDAQFSIIQSSVDGKVAAQIGQLIPGLNAVNLHTAALQAPANPKLKHAASSYVFDFYELDAQNPTFISIRMYTGAQLIDFLQSLPRKDKNTVEMNGLPTSPEYLANPQDWYMVLIQNPTPATSLQRNPDQRIQAINISKLSGPFLLTMQINNEMITQNPLIYANEPSITDVYQPSSTLLEWQVQVAKQKELKQDQQATQSPKKLNVFQPSITLLHSFTNQKINISKIPIIILPSFLYNLPSIQTRWMLLISTYLTATSNFKFFTQTQLGNTFKYFEQLGCFENNNKYAFFIDLYNRFQPDYNLYNASWLKAHAIYETDLQSCSDIQQLYTSQDSYGHCVVNEHKFYFINFLVLFEPKINKVNNQTIFKEKGFNETYAYPLNQLYFCIVNALKHEIKDGIFADLYQPTTGSYRVTWKNKSNKILSSQYVYLNHPLSNVQISFINQVENWIGSSVPTDLIQLEPKNKKQFKVTHEFSSANNKHILLAQPTSEIDKQEVFLPLQFTEYPIKELYINLFKELNITPYTHCSIIKNGVLPTPLENLTIEDWKNGIYMVPKINNNDHLTINKPGALTLLFYKADKTFLGEVTISGTNSKEKTQGISHPVSVYNAHLTKYNCQVYLYLSTGIFLQYNDLSLQYT